MKRMKKKPRRRKKLQSKKKTKSNQVVCRDNQINYMR